MRATSFFLAVCIVLVPSLVSLPAQETGVLAGAVVDPSGATITGAKVSIQTSQGSIIRNVQTDAEGSFRFSGLPSGSHILRAEAPGFKSKEIRVVVGSSNAPPAVVTLDLAVSATEVTVTAALGSVEEITKSAQVVTVRDREYLSQRPRPTIGNALEDSPGIMVQQTTYGQVSPVLRGLTGYETLLLVDGIRYNTSIFRSGPNQYLAFVDASQARSIEATLGPSSSLYGSDSLGGTINVRTVEARFDTGPRPEFHGEVNLYGASADASAGSDFLASLGNGRVNWLFGGHGRKLNDLRGGRGEDSHNVFLRFFGLNGSQVEDLLGSRMQDTGFLQAGFENRLTFRLTPDQSLTLRHLYDDQRNVRSYRDQLGGVGRLQALQSPQRLNFGYARYEKLKLGWFDSVSGTFSVNSQTDGYIRQNLRFTDPVVRDSSRIDIYGVSGQAQTHIGTRDVLVFGADDYRETVFSTRFTTYPVTGLVTQDRAQYPNNSRYNAAGLYAQNSFEILRGKLRNISGVRLTSVGFATHAKDNIGANGQPLGVTDSGQDYRFVSFNTSLVYQLTGAWSVSGLVGRGIRAPNITDLSSIGLTTLGFDVTSLDAAAAGARIGTDGSETATSTGRPYTTLKAETLMNYEAGLRYETGKLYARVQFFDAEMRDPIVGRTLVFPVAGVPTSIAGYAVTPLPQTAAQARQGVVTVATNLAARAVRSSANEGALKYYGTEAAARLRINRRWSVEGNYSFLAGRELNPNRPVRRLPPQQLFTSVRYIPSGRIWLECFSTVVGSQFRMNAADLDDDRMGASRRRTDIADFFRGGYASRYIAAGADGRLGTADDLFIPTGETLRQIQDRVLPIGSVVNGVLVTGDSTRVPTYLGSESWYTFGVRGGIPLSERLSLNFALMNLADRNYRIHGSGTDAPGVNGSLSLHYRF